jgi:hypothetical protein
LLPVRLKRVAIGKTAADQGLRWLTGSAEDNLNAE